MLGRVVSRLLFWYHCLAMAVRPEVYEKYNLSGGRTKPEGPCSQCHRQGGHRTHCRINGRWGRMGKPRW